MQHSSNPPSHHANRIRGLRWLGLLVASFLLHLIGVGWVGGYLGLPSLDSEIRSEKPPVLTAVLLEPKPAPPPAPPSPKPKPKLKPKPKKKPQPKPTAPPPAPPPAPAPSASSAPEFALPAMPPGIAPIPDMAGAEAPGADIENPATPATVENSAVSDEQPAAVQPAEPHYKANPPPSAELEYDVQALREGEKWYGSGMFRWERSSSGYSITGEASIRILFKITVLNFKSEGEINEDGVAPLLYGEKPWRKPMTNTYFEHDKNTIRFSASTASYPYEGSEQDRASIVWQLASIGRGDPGQYVPGAIFDIVVAGTRDAEPWHIQVIGQEEIETPYGRVRTWHLTRSPRPESRDQKIDIWLAPEQEWYPVKVLYSYANGDYLDMSLSDLTPGTTP